MLKLKFAAGLAAAALMTSAALAQTSPAPAGGQSPAPAPQTQTQTQSMPGGGQFMTTMPANMMRASKLMGVDVYGSDNQKIGDVDELILGKDGKIEAIVVGIGGFLGIGQKDVAIPYDQVQWMSSEEARTAAGTQTGGTTTAGGVTTPAAPAGTAGQPATTGSTGAGGTMGTAGTTTTAGAASDTTPARAMVKMSKADLQNAPEFRYTAAAATTGTGAGATGGTNPPPATRPATPQ